MSARDPFVPSVPFPLLFPTAAEREAEALEALDRAEAAELATWAALLRFTCPRCGCKAVRDGRCTRCGSSKEDMPIPFVPSELSAGALVVAVDLPPVDWSHVTPDPRLEELDDQEDDDHDDDGSHGGSL